MRIENSNCTQIYPPHTHYFRLSKEFCWQLSKMAGFFIFLFFWSGSGICAGIGWILIFWITFFDTSKDEQARTFPPLYHGPHLKQEDLDEMLQFLSISSRSLHLCTIVQVLLYKQIENSSLPTPKLELERKPKKRK